MKLALLSLIVILVVALANGKPIVSVGDVIIGNTIQR